MLLSIRQQSEQLLEESEHLEMFFNLYQTAGGTLDDLSFEGLQKRAVWRENLELMELRKIHIKEYGLLGQLAASFTEGGYCTLFREARD